MSTFVGMGVKKNTPKTENKKIKELTETVESLTKKNAELETEKVTLTETVESLTKQVEDLTAEVKKLSKKDKE